jgi:hypothetical protein
MKNSNRFQKVWLGFVALSGLVHGAFAAERDPEVVFARRQVAAMQVLDRNEVEHGNEFEIRSQDQARWERFRRDFAFLPQSAAYGENDACLVAGWEGVIREGRCRLSEEAMSLSTRITRRTPQEDAIRLALGQRCGEDEIACNPSVFGYRDQSALSPDGLHCVKRSERRMTMSCLRLSLGDAAGDELPAGVRRDTDRFADFIKTNPAHVSEQALARWAGRLALAARRNGERVVNRARELCDSVARASSVDRGLIQELERGLIDIKKRTTRGDTKAALRGARTRILEREQDIRDCQVISTVISGALRRGQASDHDLAKDLRFGKETRERANEERASGHARRPAVISAGDSR